ncbi:uncharacterized protein LOC144339547 [Macaca mulatta]
MRKLQKQAMGLDSALGNLLKVVIHPNSSCMYFLRVGIDGSGSPSGAAVRKVPATAEKVRLGPCAPRSQQEPGTGPPINQSALTSSLLKPIKTPGLCQTHRDIGTTCLWRGAIRSWTPFR